MDTRSRHPARTAARTPHALRTNAIAAAVAALVSACGGSGDDGAAQQAALAAQGKQIFRFETFGDEAKWTDTLRMQEAIAAVDPTTALSVGLKVDADALPAAVVG